MNKCNGDAMNTKKTSFFVFLMVLIVFASPFFGGCWATKIKLTKPAFINYQINDSGEQLLITEENTFASKYVFGVSTQYDGSDTSNFFTYTTDKPYMYVTDIFLNAQTYYFYVQFIGEGDYTNSQISEVNSTTIQYKLGTPTLNMIGTMLSWTKVENADRYIIYANDVVVEETTSNTYNFADYLSKQSSNVPYTFTVACKQNNNYLKSAKSNSKTYTEHLNLQAPSNLILNIGTSRVLSWDAVKNCNEYKVVINDSIERTVYTNRLDVTEYYTDVGVYSFKVMSVGEGYFKSSNYSDILNDIYTKTLATPTNLTNYMSNEYVQLGWSTVENASEYYLYLNGDRFVLNQGSGVSSPIVNNSVFINKTDLEGYDLDSLGFQVQAISADGSYYNNSSLSNICYIENRITMLSAPTITLDEENSVIKISAVQNAQLFQIDYTFDGESRPSIIVNANTSGTEFNYSNDFTELGTYRVKVKSVAQTGWQDSAYSNDIEIIISPTVTNLNAPYINSVYVADEDFCIDFDKIDGNSQTFSLYVNGNLITNTITETENIVSLEYIFSIAGEQDILAFNLSANKVDDYNLASELSNTFNLSTVLETPTGVTLNNSVLSWNSVANAQSYVLLLDDVEYFTNSNSTSVDLKDYVGSDKTRQVMVYAKTSHFTNSGLSLSKIFNNVSTKLTGYTDQYFYYGETYDLYVTSAKELSDLICYNYYNFNNRVEFYLSNYDSTTTCVEKVENALDDLEGSFGYSSSVTSSSSYGKVIVNLNFTDISTYTEHTPTYAQNTHTAQYKSSTGRDSNTQLPCEKFVVSQQVSTSDGLYRALQNKAKPVFATSNSSAEEIYNIAKQVLMEICDDTMTDYQKALAIHDYIVTNVSYDYNGLANASKGYIGYYHYLESVFLYNFAVCDGYAKAFSLLCNMEGITTTIVSGATDSSNKESTGHAWNKIYLDVDGDGNKEWYVVDCTWDDSVTSSYELLTHTYFMIPESYISERYEAHEYPTAETSNGRYYDQIKYAGTSIIVTSTSQYSTLAQYFKTSGLVGMELLVKKSISDACRFVTTNEAVYAYDFDSNYYIFIIY